MAMVGSITRGEIMGVPETAGTLFNSSESRKAAILERADREKQTSSSLLSQTMTQAEREKYYNEESEEVNEVSEGDKVADYSDMLGEGAFLGDVPFNVIMEGLTSQFNDYINIEDKSNYVDIFYDQLHASVTAVTDDVSEEHPNEIMEILDEIQHSFIDKIVALFHDRLTISFADVSAETIDYDDLEFVFRRMYEFFILGAKHNFKTVIALDVQPKVDHMEDERLYFKTLQELVAQYSPLITTFGPMEFLKYRNDIEIIEMFDNGKVVGNFLRKYSPKFYQNEEFQVEVINHITMIKQFKGDVINSVEGIIEAGGCEISPGVRNLITTATENYLALVRENVCEESSEDTDPAVYEWGSNYENSYEKGPYKD